MLFKLLYVALALMIAGGALLYFIEVDAPLGDTEFVTELPPPPPTPIMNERVRLAAGQIWITTPAIPENGDNVRITLTASTPVDVYVFPSSQNIDMDNYFQECVRKGVTQDNYTCYMTKGNAVAVFAAQGDVNFNIAMETP